MFQALLPILKGVVGKKLVSTVATTALSSLAQRSAAKAQRAQAVGDQSEQFVRLRDAAEKAGFNPLTALRANPTGGMVNPTPALASGSFITDALGAGMETYFNREQIIKDEERDMLERKLMRQELANMTMQGKAFEKSMQFGFGVGNPRTNNTTGVDDDYKGSEKNPFPYWVWIHDDMTGRTYKIPNPDVNETGISELIASSGIHASGDVLSNLGLRGKPGKAPNRAEIWRKPK